MAKTNKNRIKTQYQGVDSKLDFDILLWRQLERINGTQNLDMKVEEIDDLDNMLSMWSEDNDQYQKDIQPIKGIWEKAHLDGPAFSIFKKKYIFCKYRAIMKLMRDLSIIGHIKAIPNQEEITHYALEDREGDYAAEDIPEHAEQPDKE